MEAFWKHQWPRRGQPIRPPTRSRASSSITFSYPSVRAIVSAPVSTIRPRRIIDAGEVLLVDLFTGGWQRRGCSGGSSSPAITSMRWDARRYHRRAACPAPCTSTRSQNFDTGAIREHWPRAASAPSRPASPTQSRQPRPRTPARHPAGRTWRRRCYLQPSADDARLLRDEMAPLTERDLLNLPRYRMAVRTDSVARPGSSPPTSCQRCPTWSAGLRPAPRQQAQYPATVE